MAGPSPDMDRGEDTPRPQISVVEVRTLTRDDLPEVTRVMNEGFGTKRLCCCIPAKETVMETVARYSEYPDEKLSLWAVAILDNKIVGCVQLTRADSQCTQWVCIRANRAKCMSKPSQLVVPRGVRVSGRD